MHAHTHAFAWDCPQGKPLGELLCHTCDQLAAQVYLAERLWKQRGYAQRRDLLATVAHEQIELLADEAIKQEARQALQSFLALSGKDLENQMQLDAAHAQLQASLAGQVSDSNHTWGISARQHAVHVCNKPAGVTRRDCCLDACLLADCVKNGECADTHIRCVTSTAAGPASGSKQQKVSPHPKAASGGCDCRQHANRACTPKEEEHQAPVHQERSARGTGARSRCYTGVWSC
jgi:hypothetical protein